jgi:hypothetical protein
MVACAAPIESGSKVFACRRPIGHDDRGHAICGDITHRHGSTSCEVYGDELSFDTMLTAVKADLEAIAIDKVPGGHTHRALTLWLASVIDRRGNDDGPATTAKLADQLGRSMNALTRKGGDDDDSWGRFEDSISTPVR